MTLEIDKIILSNETQPETEIDHENTNTDVIVFLKSGEKYVASFFTFLNVESQRIENEQTGSFLWGRYFWVKNMLLIDNCTKENVESIINHLIKEGDFKEVFLKI